ncbi:helix-turn-helix domain-containing protein [Oceanobacillus kimchii]|uniref:helix-turn-helix domain-containing protein n=1 Tax=Oceanobacillus kimchii TaxID=746691 RepID=UPI00034755D6|nr:helix-turn-helix domain-containing protein [Oceanobacillus kimchii]
MNEKALKEFVGERIKNRRKLKKMTQKELGDKIGVRNNTVSQYEKGISSPDHNKLFDIAQALDCNVDEFFPEKQHNELERALKLAERLEVKDVEFLNTLIEKTLSLSESEREKFFESIKFTVEYYDKMK